MNLYDLSYYMAGLNMKISLSDKQWENILDAFEQYYFKDEDIIDLLNHFTYNSKKLDEIILDILKKSYIFFDKKLSVKNFTVYVSDSIEEKPFLEFCLLNKRYCIYNENKSQRIVNFLLKKDFNDKKCFL